ncbi:MAG: hypothetical protein J6K43_03015 [Lachnospiraceae bacterium]|nr:hypothetical protein [Lachnospiraceae bacterium]
MERQCVRYDTLPFCGIIGSTRSIAFRGLNRKNPWWAFFPAGGLTAVVLKRCVNGAAEAGLSGMMLGKIRKQIDNAGG